MHRCSNRVVFQCFIIIAHALVCASVRGSAVPFHQRESNWPVKGCIHPSIELSLPLPPDAVCSGRGNCTIDSGDNPEAMRCECPAIYAGDFCEHCSSEAVGRNGSCIHKDCLWPSAAGKVTECGNAGQCVYDGQNYSCQCFPGFSRFGRTCVGEDCIQGDETALLCNGHGYCDYGICWCLQGYSGRSCERTDGTCQEDEVYVQDLRVCASMRCLPMGGDDSPAPTSVSSNELCGEGGECSYDLERGWHCECTRYNCTMRDNVCHCSGYVPPFSEAEKTVAVVGNVFGVISLIMALGTALYGLALIPKARPPVEVDIRSPPTDLAQLPSELHT